VAEDIAAQYPTVDYVNPVVANAIERHAPLLGWTWYADGPRPNGMNGENVAVERIA